jgi:hydroxypyruvate reductase
MVGALGPDDLLLALLSGGGSALMAVPAEGMSLDDKRAVTRALLRSGAAIGEINAVRKHLSAIKGGRLAVAAWPAPTCALAVSDVPGDVHAVIASGPTAPDPTTFADARAVLARYRIDPPGPARAHLEAAREETPKPGDPRLARSRMTVIARPADALAAAARTAETAGFRPLVLGDAIEGRAAQVAQAHARLALVQAARGEPVAILSGGELTVELRGRGVGGPNHEYALALALALAEAPGIWALACDTDGIDGATDAAGALIGPDTLARAAAAGLDAARRLADNDSGNVFAALGDSLQIGPTRTNVNDLRAILVNPRMR